MQIIFAEFGVFFGNPVAIASYAVASNLVTFEYLVGNAIGLGIITIVGQCVGAGEWEQAKQYTKKLVLVNYAALVVICSLMILFRNQVVGIYNLSPEATRTSAEMLFAHSLAWWYGRWHSPFHIL